MVKQSRRQTGRLEIGKHGGKQAWLAVAQQQANLIKS